MVKIPNRQDTEFSTTYLLNNALVENGKRSQRLGLATLGHKCTRAMWMKFRWARIGQITGRISCLFELGNAVEDIAIKRLEAIGYTVTDRQDPIEGWGGHIFGYIDGVVLGIVEAPKTPHLLEVKSHNDRNYKNVVKLGVQDAKPEHWVQMLMYMGKKKLSRGLYLAVNKDTSEMHAERIYYDDNAYREYMSRGMDVVGSEVSPPNLFNDPNNRVCKFCDFSPICYEQEDYLKSCRTCVSCDIEEGGKWSCRILNRNLSYDEQVAACENYRPVR